MYTAITKTSRVSIPYVFLFFGSFINVDARSLVLKNDELGQQSQTLQFKVIKKKRIYNSATTG